MNNNDDSVDNFLQKENTSNQNPKNRQSHNTRKSQAKSLRESIGFINTNKFGEGRRILEDGDDEVDNRKSIKNRQSEKIEKLGTVAASASIFKAFVGLGILFMSNQLWETGILAMPLIMVGSLILTLYCTKLLLECADEYGDSFSDIAEAAYGSKMKRLTEILIICSQMGFCINYIYFISS